MTLLSSRIQDDYSSAISDHSERMKKFDAYLKVWRQLIDTATTAGDSTFAVPMMEWTVSGKLAQIVSLILGPDAEITAVPVGPADQKIVHKISRYMQWRLFSSMKATIPLIVWCWIAVFFGRSFMFRQWRVENDHEPQGGGVDGYAGPACYPLSPDEIVLPADEAKSIHDVSWVIRRHWPRPDDLLVGEIEGRYFGITGEGNEDQFEKILRHSQNRSRANDTGEMHETRERAEGVSMSGRGSVECVEVHEWYGRWRLPLGEADGSLTDFTIRDMRETDIVVSFIPGLNKIIGIRKLRDLYQKMERPRPFTEMSMSLDGSAWPKGLGESLFNLQNSIDANEQLIDEITRLTAMPPVFYKASAGWDPNSVPLQPGVAIPCDDTASIRQLEIKANIAPLMERTQQMLGYAQRLSRVTDPNMGLGSPNVQTAAGQLALIEQSNVGVAMDTTFLRENMARFIADVWQLDCEFADEKTFFRVAEADARGLFETSQGGAELTEEERAGRFDFTLKLATTAWSKQQRKAEAIQEYQLMVSNPLVAQNPKALWVAAAKLLKALGTGDFAEYVDQPPNLDTPKRPEEVWNLLLQGEEVGVHPLDNDEEHIIYLYNKIAMETYSEHPDMPAVEKAMGLIQKHEEAKREKAMQQATVQALAQTVAAAIGGGQAQQQPAAMPSSEQGVM